MRSSASSDVYKVQVCECMWVRGYSYSVSLNTFACMCIRVRVCVCTLIKKMRDIIGGELVCVSVGATGDPGRGVEPVSSPCGLF